MNKKYKGQDEQRGMWKLPHHNLRPNRRVGFSMGRNRKIRRRKEDRVLAKSRNF